MLIWIHLDGMDFETMEVEAFFYWALVFACCNYPSIDANKGYVPFSKALSSFGHRRKKLGDKRVPDQNL